MNEKKQKVFLAIPPTGMYNRDDRCQDKSGDLAIFSNRPPLNLMLMGGILERDRIEYFARDYPAEKLGWDDFKADLAKYDPTHLVVDVCTPTVYRDMQACRIAKSYNKDIVTIGRGAHFIYKDTEIMSGCPELDLAIRSEVEGVLYGLVKDNVREVGGITYRENGSLIRTPDNPALDNIDCMGELSYRVFDPLKYRNPETGKPEATIIVGRGCPYKCIYCLAGPVHGNKVRLRSVQSVIAEIERLAGMGIKDFIFRSDLFTYDEEWLFDMCSNIMSLKYKIRWCTNSRADTIDSERLNAMKKAGCWGIGFGIESGNLEILRKIKKGITPEQAENAIRLTRQHGVKALAYFIIGFPWEGKDEIEDTIRFAKRLNADFTHFSAVYPYPGTEYYDIAVRNGLMKENEFPPDALTKPVIGTFYLSVEEVRGYFNKAWRQCYLRPSYIYRTLRSTENLRQLMNYSRAGYAVCLKLARNMLSGGTSGNN
ncbi:B12-binding domain-containing radical SAM protein [Candidatus Auribacterota bacterium]